VEAFINFTLVCIQGFSSAFSLTRKGIPYLTYSYPI